jgi:hypothetical protein
LFLILGVEGLASFLVGLSWEAMLDTFAAYAARVENTLASSIPTTLPLLTGSFLGSSGSAISYSFLARSDVAWFCVICIFPLTEVFGIAILSSIVV